MQENESGPLATCEYCGAEDVRMLSVYEAVGTAAADVWALRKTIENLKSKIKDDEKIISSREHTIMEKVGEIDEMKAHLEKAEKTEA